jgi:hypothetical protein
MKRHVAGPEGKRAVYTNPIASRPASIAIDDDVGRSLPDRKQIPKRQRAAVTHSRSPVLKNRSALPRPAAESEHGCHPAGLGQERGVTHCVNPTMHSVQQSRGHTMLNRPPAEITPTQLIDGHHPMLLPGYLSNPQAGSGDFYPHEGA